MASARLHTALYAVLMAMSIGSANQSGKESVLEKVEKEKAVLFTRHELKSPADIGRHAGKDIPMLEELAKKHGYEVAGPIEHAYWDMARKGVPHYLEIWLPVKKKTVQNLKEYKEVREYKCLSMPFKDGLETIGEAWGEFGKVAASIGVKGTAHDREVYHNLDFEDPTKNQIELQMGTK